MKKVINKGYTLSIISWENDGDNYRTKIKTVETIDEAEKLHKICKELFVSKNNGKGGVGNSMDGEGNATIIKYVDKNRDLFPVLLEKEEDEIIDYFSDLAYNLMGNSEYYDFRIVESCTVTYSDKDVFLEEVQF